MIDFITYEHLTPCTVCISRNSHYTSVRAQLSLEYIIGSFRENSCLPQSLNHSQNITDVLLSKSSEDLPCLVQWGAGPQFILLIWTKTACHWSKRAGAPEVIPLSIPHVSSGTPVKKRVLVRQKHICLCHWKREEQGEKMAYSLQKMAWQTHLPRILISWLQWLFSTFRGIWSWLASCYAEALLEPGFYGTEQKWSVSCMMSEGLWCRK